MGPSSTQIVSPPPATMSALVGPPELHPCTSPQLRTLPPPFLAESKVQLAVVLAVLMCWPSSATPAEISSAVWNAKLSRSIRPNSPGVASVAATQSSPSVKVNGMSGSALVRASSSAAESVQSGGSVSSKKSVQTATPPCPSRTGCGGGRHRQYASSSTHSRPAEVRSWRLVCERRGPSTSR